MVELIELSIEETNKLRAQLDLPLISINTDKYRNNNESAYFAESRAIRFGGSSGESEYQKDTHIKDSDAKSKTKRNNKSSSIKNKEPNFRKVIFNYDDVDTDSWLHSVGKIKTSSGNSEVKITIKNNIADLERAQAILKHTAISSGQHGDVETFTLADSGVLDDSANELVNEKLAKESKLATNLKERQQENYVKFGKPRLVRDDNDDNENYSDTIQLAPLILERGMISLASSQKSENKDTYKDLSSGKFTSLDALFEDVESSKPKLVIKKLKSTKAKNKSTRKRKRENASIEDPGPIFTTTLEEYDDPEDDFEAVLNCARLNKNKARKKLTAEEIAQDVKSHKRHDFAAELDTVFVYDDTKDFLNTIGTIQTDSRSLISSHNLNITSSAQLNSSPSIQFTEPAKSVVVSDSFESVEETKEPSVKDKSRSLDLNSVSATLKYLRATSTISSDEKWRKTKPERERQREAELARIQINIEERLIREQLTNDYAFLRMKLEDQEKVIDHHLNEILIQKGIIAKAGNVGRYAKYTGPADPLQDYSPKVNVKYTDSKGNQLNTKQAWKELSHRYHESGPKHKKGSVFKQSTEEREIHLK